MKRIVAMAVVITFACAGLAQAQDRPVPVKVRVSFAPKTTAASTPAAGMFSKASIENAVEKLAKDAPAPPPRQSRPIYKKAWPYVVGAIAAALIIYFATRDSDSSGNPY